MNDQKPKSVMIAGGGISGVCAAIRLAETGCPVYLVEKSPFIGGILARLDHQFPNNGCGMCRMLPMQNRTGADQVCLRKGFFHVNVSVLPLTEIQSVSGAPGNFSASLTQNLHGVDPDKCIGCGKCDAVCPVTVPDSFNCGLSETKAVFAPLPHQYPAKRIIDLDRCTRCGECLKVCPTDAIDFDLTSRSFDIGDIAGIIACTGTDFYHPETTDLYGFGRFPNVVTSTAFERILSSSGPFAGKPVRPSDGAALRKVAWAQCVGSRNLTIGADYCSSVCCMMSVKEAVLFHEKRIAESPDACHDHAQSAIFYMDMRTFGRDFQRYRDRAEIECGVRFIRSRIHSIEQENEAGDLKVRYVSPTGNLEQEIFDMVVLAAGQNPKQTLPDFARHDGVLVMHDGSEFKDIAESVLSAQAAAARMTRKLQQQGIQTGSRTADADLKPAAANAVFQQKSRIQAILFENDAPDINWRQIAEKLAALPGKVEPVRLSSVQNPADWEQIGRLITSGNANRWVVACCYPYPLWTRIKELTIQTGLPETLIEVSDLHYILQDSKDSEAAAEAILRQLEMTTDLIRKRRAPAMTAKEPNRSALVIGAGPAGLSAALTLADCGAEVVIVEKTGGPGGCLASCKTPELKQAVDKLVRDAADHPKIKLLTNSEVISGSGISGNFTTRVRDLSGNEQTVAHGAVIIAAGGHPGSADAYELGTHERIVSQFDFENVICDPAFAGQTLNQVVMIQCAGCREEPKNYCSRVCCRKSLNHALRIKEIHPGAEVIIFYRDMMTYGQSETLYTEARRKGVLFFPFEKNRKPQIQIDSGAPSVTGFDPFFQNPFTVRPDWVSLAVGVEPNPIGKLLNIFKIQSTPDGFVQEADSKWRPTDTDRTGVFAAGLVRNPVCGNEAMIEGEAAAMRTWAFLLNESQSVCYPAAIVRHSLCSRCEACLDACPYHARFRDAEFNRIEIDPAACQGCGACAAVCPNSATVIGNFEDGSVMDMIEAAL